MSPPPPAARGGKQEQAGPGSPELTLASDPVHGPVFCLQVSRLGGPDDEMLQVTPGQCWAGSKEDLGTEVSALG